ncbi:MAG: hypothetical protein ACI4OI_08185 [Gemmiger sp.]
MNHLISFAQKHRLLFVLVLVQVLFLAGRAGQLWLPVWTYDAMPSLYSAHVEALDSEITEQGARLTENQEQAFAEQWEASEEQGVPLFQSDFAPPPAGLYKISITYQSQASEQDTAGSCVFLGQGSILNEGIPLPGNRTHAEGRVWIYGTTTSTALAILANDSSLCVQSMQIEEVWSWRLTTLLTALLLFLLADLLLLVLSPRLNLLHLSDAQRLAVFSLLALTLFVSIPAMDSSISYGFDLEFHLSRISGIAQGLRDGQFPVRIYPDFLYGYGYASPVFYGDLLLYPSALLVWMGYPLCIAYQVYIVLLNLMTAVISYCCAHKAFHSRRMAMTGAVLYTASAYRIINLYYRPALGEASAQTFLPLILYGFWALYAEAASEKQHRGAWLPLLLGYTGVIQTHVISTELSALLGVGIVLVCWKKAFRRENLLLLVKGALGTVLVNLWFLVPFFQYMQGDFRCTAADTVFEADLFRIPLPQLLLFGDMGFDSIRPGPALLAGALLLAACLIWQAGSRTEQQFTRLGTWCLVGTGITFYFCCGFEWSRLTDWFGATIAHYLCAIQFPFRLLTLATVLLCTASLCGLALTATRKGPRAASVCAACLTLLCVVSAWESLDSYNTKSYGKIAPTDVANFADARETSGLEYVPAAFDADIYHNQPDVVADTALYTYERDGLCFTVEAQNASDRESAIDFPLTYYPSYRLTENSGGDAVVCESPHGTVRVVLCAGYTGTFRLAFVPPRSWRAAELVSLLTLLALAVSRLRGRRAWRR